MHYYGGKHRTGKSIAALIESLRDGRAVYEPFCGSLNVTRHLSGVVHASDVNHHMVELINRCSTEGTDWLPDTLSEDEYNAIKHSTTNPPGLLAFAMVGCGFGGKWNQGYARQNGPRSSFASTAKRGLTKKIADLSSLCDITHSSYDTLDPHDSLVYCDPPYADTGEGYLTRKFDTDAFWNKMRLWSKDNIVLVSELTAPPDFEAIWERKYTQGLGSNCADPQNKVVEKVFRLLSNVAPNKIYVSAEDADNIANQLETTGNRV